MRAIERYAAIWLPFVDAYEAGLWVFYVMPAEVVAVEQPALRVAGDQLHCENGPAVAWAGGERYWFWRGVQVPRRVVEAPETLTTREIGDEPNAEVRRVMLERFGFERFMRASGARVVQQDDYGKLWRRDLVGDEPLVMVEVENSTPEPDGSTKTYMLRVPPTIRTARGAVAWSFGYGSRAYAPAVET